MHLCQVIAANTAVQQLINTELLFLDLAITDGFLPAKQQTTENRHLWWRTDAFITIQKHESTVHME